MSKTRINSAIYSDCMFKLSTIRGFLGGNTDYKTICLLFWQNIYKCNVFYRVNTNIRRGIQ